MSFLVGMMNRAGGLDFLFVFRYYHMVAVGAIKCVLVLIEIP